MILVAMFLSGDKTGELLGFCCPSKQVLWILLIPQYRQILKLNLFWQIYMSFD